MREETGFSERWEGRRVAVRDGFTASEALGVAFLTLAPFRALGYSAGGEGRRETVQVTLLKSKLHNVRVTESDRDYEGSLKIDEDLMEAVGIVPYERILVANVENGNRFETYAIPGPRGSRVIGLNGATTHLGSVGDRVIVFAFCQIPAGEVSRHKPRILVFDAGNRPVGGLKKL